MTDEQKLSICQILNRIVLKLGPSRLVGFEMGVKGLWPEVLEVTPGAQMTLAKLNAEFVRKNGRPLRLAVDTPFAVFQYNEATRKVVSYGGMNHPTRTLYYHILHLLRAGVQPIFVYDGPSKPPIKRGSHVHFPRSYEPYSPSEASSLRTQQEIDREYDLQHITHLSKEVLDLLRIPWFVAKGEAEAECAELEKAGIADAVLTKDGDAFVFGARTVVQRLDAENKIAMVRVFHMQDLEKAKPALTKKHLLLLALMAGGDYDDGIRGCGAAIAIEIARAGYCFRLYDLLRTGRPVKQWRDELVQELRTNERRRLSSKHPSIAAAFPATFPSQKIADYYLKPAVSSQDALTQWASRIDWHKEVDVSGLRRWTEKYFDWRYAFHAGKFLRNLAPAMLTHRLMAHAAAKTDGSHLIIAVHQEKGDDDESRELRVSYKPADVVDLDISQEEVVESYRSNMAKVFDPEEVQREWVPKWLIENTASAKLLDWQQVTTAKSSGKRKGENVATNMAVDVPPKRPRGRPPKISAGIVPTEPVLPPRRVAPYSDLAVQGKGLDVSRRIPKRQEASSSHAVAGVGAIPRNVASTSTAPYQRGPTFSPEVIDLTED